MEIKLELKKNVKELSLQLNITVEETINLLIEKGLSFYIYEKPNISKAGMPWNEESDILLVNMYKSGETSKSLSEFFNRTIGAINSRLNKLLISKEHVVYPMSKEIVSVSSTKSEGEDAIKLFLERNKIEYVAQKKFPGCKLKNELPFDFFIPSMNLLIEYDGIHHRMPVLYKGEGSTPWHQNRALVRLEQQKYRDKIKTDYCKKNNIHLIRFTEIKTLDEKLENVLLNRKLA